MLSEFRGVVDCLVVDVADSDEHWARLLDLPERSFVAVEALMRRDAVTSSEGDNVNDLWRNLNRLDTSPTAILINADLHVLIDKHDSESGTELALRLRQDPDRVHCPIILVSFRREIDAIEDDQVRSAGQLKTLLAERWQARWLRLPAGRETIIDEMRTAYEEFLKKVSGQSPTTVLRSLSGEICKGQVEYTHKRYLHGRGSFTAALWLVIDALRTRNISLIQANDIVKAIRSNPKQRPGDDVILGYDFDRFIRLLKLLEVGGAVRPDAALQVIQERKRKLLLIEDEYGWLEVLERLLPRWNIVTAQENEEIVNNLDRADLVLVDHILKAKAVGVDKIRLVRAHNSIIPTALFTNDRRASLLAAAMKHGADGVILKQSTDASRYGTVGIFSDFCTMLADLSTIEPTQLGYLVGALERTRQFARSGDRSLRHASIDLGWSTALLALGLGLHGPFETEKRTYNAKYARAAYIWLGGALDKLFPKSSSQEKSQRVRAAIEVTARARHGSFVNADATHLRNIWYEIPKSRAGIPLGWPLPITTNVISKGESEHDERADVAVRWLLLGYYAAKGLLTSEHRQLWRSSDKLTEAELRTIRSSVEPGAEKKWQVPEQTGKARTLHVVDSDAHSGGLFKVLCRILDDEPIAPRVGATSIVELDQVLDTKMMQCGRSDCILLDIGLPKEQGQQKTRFVSASQLESGPLEKVRGKYPDVPIIIFSATENASIIYRCMFRDAEAAYDYQPKVGGIGDLGDNDAASIDYLKRFYTEFRQRLDPSAPLVARRYLLEFETKLKHKLRELRNLDHRLLSLGYEQGLRVAREKIFELTGETGGEVTLGSLLRDYIKCAFDMLYTAMWFYEFARTRALIDRVDRQIRTALDEASLVGDQEGEASGSMDKYVWVLAASTTEWLSRIMLTIVTGVWPEKDIGLQDHIYPWILLNRDLLKCLSSEPFNRCLINLWLARNAAYYKGRTLREHEPNRLLDSFCRSTELILDQLIALPHSDGSLLTQERRSSHRFGKDRGGKVAEAVRLRRVLSGIVVGERRNAFYVHVKELDWVGIMKNDPGTRLERLDQIKVELIEKPYEDEDGEERRKIVVRRA